MTGTTDVGTVAGSSAERLVQQAYGTADRADRFRATQVCDVLNVKMREFIARQEMMFVSTADANGHCDATFRAGPEGFVRVLDAERIAWPEYRGNGVLASIANLTDNPHVGVLFMDFVRDVIGLHVNGAATVVPHEEFRAAHPDEPIDAVAGRSPERWVVVHVEEAYVHCRKHIPRLAKVPRERAWGSDDTRRKGGDFFDVAAERKAAAESAGETASPEIPLRNPVPTQRLLERSPAMSGSDIAAVAGRPHRLKLFRRNRYDG